MEKDTCLWIRWSLFPGKHHLVICMVKLTPFTVSAQNFLVLLLKCTPAYIIKLVKHTTGHWGCVHTSFFKRHKLFRDLLQTIRGLSHAMKIFGYQTTHSTFFYRVAEYFYEFTMAHDVQEAFLVEVNYRLVALIIYLLRSS